MKIIYTLFTFLIIISNPVHAQVSINADGSQPDPSEQHEQPRNRHENGVNYHGFHRNNCIPIIIKR